MNCTFFLKDWECPGWWDCSLRGCYKVALHGYAELAIRRDQLNHWVPRGVGRTFHRECLGTTPNGTPVYEQVET